MKKHIILVSIVCCIGLYWVYERFVPCIASPQERAMKIMSPAFNNNSTLPLAYTCHGKNINPPLQWENVPNNTKSLVMVMSDPDAPQPNPWIHWVLFNISPKTNKIKEGAQHLLKEAKRGENTAKTLEYYGACPPKGHGVHHYHFMLYALDTMVELPDGVSYQAIKEAMQGHIIAQADLVGLYETL